MGTGVTAPEAAIRVLFVDTDSTMAEAFSNALDSDEHELAVLSEADPDDALDRLEATRVDCLVSEYALPGTDGIELFDMVRERGSAVPFVLFTGSGNERIASQAVSAGVTEYVRKGPDGGGVESLAERVLELLDTEDTTVEPSSTYDRAQFRKFMEAFPDATFVIDEQGRYVDLISAGNRSPLYSDTEELIGQRVADLLPEETAERFLRTIQRALETGEQQQLEYQLDVEEGTRWFEARVGPIDTDSRPRTVFWIAHDITARKRREHEYQQIFDEVQGGITVNDPETAEILDVNESFCDLLGYDREEILERDIASLSAEEHGFTMDRAREIVQDVVSSGESQRVEWAVETADGETRWLDIRGTTAEIGGERRYLSLSRDITERRRREREYEQIFDSVKDAIAVFDPDTGHIVDVNEAYCDMVGYDDLETIRKFGIEGLSATDEGYTGERGTELIKTVDSTGESRTVDWRAETGDGDRLWLEATLAPATIDGEDRVLSIQRNVTEHRELEQTYRDIFDNVSDGLVVHEPDTGEILQVNERYCEITGYDRAELLEETIRLIIPDDPEYTSEQALERIRRAREEGPQLFEFKGKRKDGEIFIGEVHLRSVDIRGTERILASVRDITERKHRERAYEQIFNGVNDIIAVRDPETGELVDANQSYAELLGYDREALRGTSISDIGVTEDGYDDQRGSERLESVMESAESVEFEWKVEDADGNPHLIDVRATDAPINGERRYLAIGRDVTERKRRERAIDTLQSVTERLQTARTPGEVATIAVEAASEMLELPVAVCWFHEGQRLEPVAGTDPAHDTNILSTLSPDRYEYDVFESGTTTEYTPCRKSSDNPLRTGVLLPLAATGLIAVGAREDTTVDETVLDVAKALADHVTTALERVEQAKAVRESERRFRLIAERIDEVIYLAEPDFSDVLYVNPAYEEVWGRPIGELEERPKAFLEAVDQRDRDELQADLETMIADIQSGRAEDSYDFEYRIRRPDGEVRWVNATGYGVELTGGNSRFVGIVEDSTERKRREQRLEVFNRILRHNLRNQVDVIRSHAEELATRTDTDHAERIIASADELASIGAKARETDRIVSTNQTTTDVGITETVRDAVETAVPDSDDLTVATDLPESTTLSTYRDAVAIAVRSAVENAVEYADSRVTVRVTDTDDAAVVAISDDGPGIPQGQLAPIETGTETNFRHSRGLGLWRLSWSVDKLNGKLSFDTNDGTTVRIEIPDTQQMNRTV